MNLETKKKSFKTTVLCNFVDFCIAVIEDIEEDGRMLVADQQFQINRKKN